MLVLSYVWLLCLIPLLTEKEDREIQWHAKHGTVLFAAGFALMLVLSFFSTIRGLGCIAALLTPLVGVGLAVLHILAMVKAINGERLLLPWISDFADKF
jgi:uncharacterized membrane protein